MILEVVLQGEGAPLKVRGIWILSCAEVWDGWGDDGCAVRFWIYRGKSAGIDLMYHGLIIECPGEGVMDGDDVISLTAHTLSLSTL